MSQGLQRSVVTAAALANHNSTVLMAQVLALTLLVLVLHTTAASESQAVTISYHSHYPVASERPNICEVAFRSEPRNVSYTPGQYIPFIGEELTGTTVCHARTVAGASRQEQKSGVQHLQLSLPRRAAVVSHGPSP